MNESKFNTNIFWLLFLPWLTSLTKSYIVCLIQSTLKLDLYFNHCQLCTKMLISCLPQFVFSVSYIYCSCISTTQKNIHSGFITSKFERQYSFIKFHQIFYFLQTSYIIEGKYFKCNIFFYLKDDKNDISNPIRVRELYITHPMRSKWLQKMTNVSNFNRYI